MDDPANDSPHRHPWRDRRDRVLANRAISVPTLVTRRFFTLEGLRSSATIAFNLFICVVPLATMVAAGITSARGHDLTDLLVNQFGLHGSTATLLRNAFADNEHVLAFASVITVLSFAVTGLDVAGALQAMFARAFQVAPMKGLRGAGRGAIWFGLMFAQFVGAQMMGGAAVTRNGPWTYAIAVPVSFATAFGLWFVAPPLLLDRPLGRRERRPGAVLGAVGTVGVWFAGRFVLPGWFDWYGRGFGSIGIALALASWLYVTAIVWVVIIVAAGVWWERTASVEAVVALVSEPSAESETDAARSTDRGRSRPR